MIVLYTLKSHNVTCELYFSKVGKKKDSKDQKMLHSVINVCLLLGLHFCVDIHTFFKRITEPVECGGFLYSWFWFGVLVMMKR